MDKLCNINTSLNHHFPSRYLLFGFLLDFSNPMAVAVPGELNLLESPNWGSRSVDCFEKLEQIGEGTYGYCLFSPFLIAHTQILSFSFILSSFLFLSSEYLGICLENSVKISKEGPPPFGSRLDV